MMLCKVTGNVVAPVKNVNLNPCKLLIVQPIDLDGNYHGSDLLAIDTVDAGIGDRVLIAQEGDVVMQVMKSKEVPANTIIMAVVDDMEVGIR